MSSSYHHGDLENALLQDATRVLEETGPESLSLRALARTLGVSHAAPRHHFSDRRGLLAEIAADGFAALADRLEEALRNSAGSEPEDLIHATGLAYVDVAMQSPQRFKLMFGGGFLGSEDCPDRLRDEASRAYQALLRIARGRDLSQEDLAAAHPESSTMEVPELAVWALVHGAATLQIDGALVLDCDQFRTLFGRLLSQLASAAPGLWRVDDS